MVASAGYSLVAMVGVDLPIPDHAHFVAPRRHAIGADCAPDGHRTSPCRHRCHLDENLRERRMAGTSAWGECSQGNRIKECLYSFFINALRELANAGYALYIFEL